MDVEIRQCPFPDCGAIIGADVLDCPVCHRDLAGMRADDVTPARRELPYWYVLLISCLWVGLAAWAAGSMALTVSDRAWLVLALVWALAFLVSIGGWLQGGQPTTAGTYDPQSAGRRPLRVHPPLPPTP